MKLLAVFCVLSWRVFWITLSSRATPEAPPDVALTSLKIKILDQLIRDNQSDPSPSRGLAFYAIKIARLGGYLNRTRDPSPDNIVMWCGLTRLTDIALGLSLAMWNAFSEFVGN